MKPTKPLSLALLSGALLIPATSLQAGPRFAGGDVTVQGTLSVTDSSRVSPNADAGSDTIFGFTPAIYYTRESNRMNMEANLSLPMRRYDENDYLDSDSLSFGLSGEIPFGAGPKLSGNWGVSFFDGVQESYLTNRTLDSETFSANAYADYVLQRRLSFRARTSYSDRSSSGIDTSFSNANTTTLFAAGLHARELIRGRIGLYAEYQIQDRKTDRGLINQAVDDTDDGLNFGITGQILPERLFPKLDADLSFGFTSTSASDRVSSRPGAGRSNRLTLNGSLAYPANAKTNVALTYSRNLSVTDDDQTVEQSQINLSVDYTPRQKLTFITSVGMQSNDFIYDLESRNDDVLTANFSTRYSIRSNWTASLSYNYRDSESNLELSNYDSSQLTLSTTISY
ncbi:outer membrane beta-barrel protein [Pelagicoccus sp. SDUM812005]|uniref:outer membrane beta-barrel protein n=1 Tax=Pelagicoccus sp. SDUM812005 TaxID=3041257 RepID=UPI00280EBB66|nr:outer membrane beta-barrel protein [Pelagicoccus sp. SDUM812005]MDQ8179467.1 outer membrane beta-barrel protein [Pelagicoccus sp. SDUM812005]